MDNYFTWIRHRRRFDLITIATTLLLAQAKPCSVETLKSRIGLRSPKRGKPWICEGVHLKSFDSWPWEKWTWDDEEAFAKLKYKVLVPRAGPEGLNDTLWTLGSEPFSQFSRGTKTQTARPWIKENVHPGMAVAIEGLHHLSVVKKSHFFGMFLAEVGVPGGVDLYAALAGGGHKGPVGSYGWHADTVDALIYILEGKKRVRIAGHYPGSKVVVDKVLEAGSAAYVPAGCFHTLLALDDDSTKLRWVRVLSFGLLVPQQDLMHERVDVLRESLKAKGISWSDKKAIAAALPESLPKKPTTPFWNVDAFDPQGHTALHRRSLRGDVAFINFLLMKQKASVDLLSRPAKGPKRTALGIAICCGPDDSMHDVVKALLKNGADASKVEIDPSSGTVLNAKQVAAARNKATSKKVKKLLSKTADEL
eukprot:TRINITY_DN18140_c0_g3_i1.p1 TRINITY_DN18140_c0_g3~~TRINITY_DN18140_c0_g3_i1.p1  ORF type:complete len:421 (+),score=72.57 TRINITY_DN18140_c0_g3_i1:37-1299(+)